jgi:hypothetical protein
MKELSAITICFTSNGKLRENSDEISKKRMASKKDRNHELFRSWMSGTPPKIS